MQTLTNDDFKVHIFDGEAYFLHAVEVSERSVGREKLLISYKAGDEEEIRINVTNLMQHSDRSLLCLLRERWKIGYCII